MRWFGPHDLGCMLGPAGLLDRRRVFAVACVATRRGPERNREGLPRVRFLPTLFEGDQLVADGSELLGAGRWEQLLDPFDVGVGQGPGIGSGADGDDYERATRVGPEARRTQHRYRFLAAPQIGEVDVGVIPQRRAFEGELGVAVAEAHVDASADQTPESVHDVEALFDDEVAQVVRQPRDVGRELPAVGRAVSAANIDSVPVRVEVGEPDRQVLRFWKHGKTIAHMVHHSPGPRRSERQPPLRPGAFPAYCPRAIRG